MRRGRIPLTALRSFEAAGRLNSFTLASEELLVSQAAVSRQIKELERILGQALFERHHRAVVLTPAGKKLLAVLTQAFDGIGTIMTDLTHDAAQPVIVSSEPSFASSWLVRNLARFRQEHPEIDIELDADPRMVEFRNGQSIIAIRHSATQSLWPRSQSLHLADVNIVPVMAPGLLAKSAPLEQPVDLLAIPLLHEETRDLWQQWFVQAELTAEIERGIVYSDGGLIHQAALQGEGVALLDDLFAQEDLQKGRLIQPFEMSIRHGAYFVVAKDFSTLSEGAVAFVTWLQANVR